MADLLTIREQFGHLLAVFGMGEDVDEEEQLCVELARHELTRLERPADLNEALGSRVSSWDEWPRSIKRGTLEWIKTAKTEPTRAKRIADVVFSIDQGLRPTPFRR